MRKINAFTLAEIMIVLTVIGVLTAILLPVAFEAAPDENVIKFKKANSTLSSVIRELVNSDRYYLDGDLGVRFDGTLIDGSHNGDLTYFCKTFADAISAKSVNCSENETCKGHYCWQDTNTVDLENMKKYADEGCKYSESIIGAEIIAADDTVFYQVSPVFTFGITEENAQIAYATSEERDSYTVYNEGRIALIKDSNGFERIYKTFCIDIDGINEGEDPFGYMIRYDGRILYGARADEWMEKSVQRND